MKFSNFKHSGSETKILTIGDMSVHIGPKISSLFSNIRLITGPHPLATVVTKL
jgi:hypothetical protein